MPTNNRPNISNHPFISRTPKIMFLNPCVRISYIRPTTYIIHIICNTQSRTYNQSIHKKTHNACCDLIMSRGLLDNLLPRPSYQTMMWISISRELGNSNPSSDTKIYQVVMLLYLNDHGLSPSPSSPRYSCTYALIPSCDTQKPGGPVDHRQPTETYESHTMRTHT